MKTLNHTKALANAEGNEQITKDNHKEEPTRYQKDEAIDIVTQKILNGWILLIGVDSTIQLVEEIYGGPTFEIILLQPKGHYLILGKKNEEFREYLSKTYLFSWDEIPGNDDDLKEFLSFKFDIDWVKTAEIEKKIDDIRTIRISNKQNFILLKLDTKTTKVKLKIDDGRTDKFDVELENGKLKIYSPTKMDFQNMIGLIFSYKKIESIEIEELNVNSVKDWVHEVIDWEYSTGLYF